MSYGGKALLLSTPQGEIAKSLLKDGCALGISTRGVGNIVDNVVTNYQLLTFDLVGQPSTGAWINGVLESKGFEERGGMIVEVKSMSEEIDTNDIAKNDTGEKSNNVKKRENEDNTESNAYDDLISVLALIKDLLPSPTYAKLLDAIQDPTMRPERKREMIQMVLRRTWPGRKSG